ncbi:MAG TPA: tRNA pseudouridine(55) synthase TruB [Candidatus Faecousia faecigallinarum]|nr:tRNA pseudouridine(55) synthase TruB [Candidatus Faecousia faecigallinarum]
MASGIIIIDKPQGWTSQDVAARLRRVFGTRRVGHGGTLDPMATGVLPVMVGRATRGAAFLENARKQYMATLRLGLLTDTEDTTGTVLETRPVTVGREDVEAMFRRFLGRQMQVPPMYSAVKVDGKKLYTLARQGRHIERAPRPIEIYRLELVQVQDRDYTFLVDCSKGTYIRTLCKDIGLALGCGGTMAALRRTQAGAYSLDDAISLECLLDMAEAGDPVERLLRPVDSLFPHCPKVELSPKQERICRNGGVFSTALPSGDYRLYGGGEFLALARCAGGEMKTIKSFFEVN